MHLPSHPSARRFVPFAAVLPRLAPVGLLAGAACATSAPEPLFEESGELTAAAAPGILSAYLGAVDQALIPFCPTLPAGAVLEGLPVVFNRQIYNPSLRASRFLVTSSTGISAGEEDDNDNILDVCLASAARPAAITVAAGAYTAPNGLPTTATTIAIE